ncbi:methyltransferase FkbM [uncultured Helicobacter sp.]|uniref:methyltransferase FkbM n=1 Tax=uncultured Helicobacter sp. TaxID=175537 RepID=UPI00261C4CEA|nr:methyltransferase FkbM [uncultured Helicobacter sp.]
MQFNTPILIVTYKRLDTTFEVLKTLKNIQAKKIYISSNHWKDDAEKATVLLLRERIKNYIDWECQLNFIIHTEHLKVKDSFSSAINIFFEKEEKGIILEDDIVPNQSFFFFCQEMLEKYKDNSQIFMISGWSALDFHQDIKNTLKEDYFFSQYCHIWGWATWARAWKMYEKEFENFEEDFNQFEFNSKEEKTTWYKIFKAYNEDKIDTWDHPWTFTIRKHNGFSIYPKNNMIKNIGFNRDDATNTKSWSKYEEMHTYDLPLHLSHPQEIKRNQILDMHNFIITTKETPKWLILINKIYRIIFGKNLRKFKEYMR